MSRSKRTDKAGAAAAAAFDRARQAAAQVKPVSSSAQAAAGRGLHTARAFAAPQLERAGQALEDSIAPKVSAMLSAAAQRLEPVKPRRRRWRKLAGISLFAAAASAVAAVVVRNRAKPDLTPAEEGGLTPPEETGTDSAAPVAQMREEKARTSTDADADVDGQVRTP
jgi:hypothetical protein